jgi:hypothetical protein
VLVPDTRQLAQFFGCLFAYADEGSFISMRTFAQSSRDESPLLIEGVPIKGSPDRIVARAAAAASDAANGERPGVFCPPVATFTNSRTASMATLANGLALSVELDEGNPRRALARLEMLLGPVTLATASGGEWIDPASGEAHPKQHFHWRLSEATCTSKDHEKLREARLLAAVLVDADLTAASPVHPMRWPGSWNLKRTPRMAIAVAHNPAAEIHLDDALEALQMAVEAAGFAVGGTSGIKASGEPEAPLADIAAALAFIPNTDAAWDGWNHIGMATWRATGGSAEGLRLWADWSAKSPKHDEAACLARWKHYATSPPTRVGAGTLFFLARAAGWQRPAPHRDRVDDGPPEPPLYAEAPDYWQGEPDDPEAAISDDDWDGRDESESPDPEPREGAQQSAGADKQKPAGADKQKPAALWIDADDYNAADIAERDWVAPGFLMRGQVTEVIGQSASGKSSLVVMLTIATATGQRVGNFAPREQYRVVNYNVEDDQNEQRRRYSAALSALGLTPAAIAGRVIRCGPSSVGTLFERHENGRVTPTDAMNQLEALCVKTKADVLVCDPLAELHNADENDNTAMRAITAAFRGMAQRLEIAILLLHHDRKGSPTPGDIDRGRGASAVGTTVRVTLTLTTMTEVEADRFGVLPNERRQHFRVDGGKVNYGPRGDAEWWRLTAVTIANGESVAAALPWHPPSTFNALSFEASVRVLEAIRRGLPDGSAFASKKLAGEDWAGRLLMAAPYDCTEGQAAAILAVWVKAGTLIEGKLPNPKRRGHPRLAFTVNEATLSKMRQQSTENHSDE